MIKSSSSSRVHPVVAIFWLIVGLSAIAVFPLAATATETGANPSDTTSAKSRAVLRSTDTALRSADILARSRFIFRSDRICRRQVPAFKKIEHKLNYYDKRYTEAIEAEKYDLARKMLGLYGKTWQKVGKLLSKRERLIRNLLPVSGKSPHHYLAALHRLARSVKKLGGSARVLAKTPSTANSKRFKAASRQAGKATTGYFKAARGYGFKSCSKPLAVR